MLKYIARKILFAIPLLIAVVTFTFFMLEAMPGSVADKFFTPETPPELREMIIAKYQLDQPSYIRYFAMMKNLITLDFGESIAHGRPVIDMIKSALPNTMILASLTLMIAFPTGIILGTIQAIRHNTSIDTGISIASLTVYSAPGFWLAMMMQLVISYHLGMWFTEQAAAGTLPQFVTYFALPFSGMYDAVEYEYMSNFEKIIDRIRHLILPGVAMGLASAGGAARYMRSSLLEIIRQDFVRTARAKGLRERTVVIRHAMRNGLLPIVTLIGLSLPALFSGSVLIETIFSWPGMGREILAAVYTQDTPMIVACFFVYTLLVVCGNLFADIAYAFVDPRIKFD